MGLFTLALSVSASQILSKVDRGNVGESLAKTATSAGAKAMTYVGTGFYARILPRLRLIAAFCLLGSSVPFVSAQAVQGDSCGDATTTAAMRNCESARFEKANKQLQSVYDMLAGHLDAVGKQKLRAAQEAWLHFRDASAEFEADSARGGTLAGVIRITTLANMTESRAAELKKDVEQSLSMK